MAQAQAERDDLSLLAASARGDHAAFNELVLRHQAVVFRVARRVTTSDAAAEDALQETFIAAFKHAGEFRGQGTVRAWLLSIAHRSGLRSLRRRVGEPERFETLDELGAAAGWGASDTSSHDDDRRAALDTALASLSAEDRAIIVLRDLEDLSTAEAAAALGLTSSASKVRLHRARLRLMAALRETGGAPHGP